MGHTDPNIIYMKYKLYNVLSLNLTAGSTAVFCGILLFYFEIRENFISIYQVDVMQNDW